MPTEKDFKRLVRQRMAATGEQYTQARAALDTRIVDVDPLLAQLRDPDWKIRRRACQALDDVAFTPESFKALTELLDDPRAEVRRAAVHTLTCVHCKPDGCVLDIRGVLERAKHDRSRRVRQMVIGPLWGGLVREPWADELLAWFVAHETSEQLRRLAQPVSYTHLRAHET